MDDNYDPKGLCMQSLNSLGVIYKKGFIKLIC